jgi:hypothetical protein
MGTWGTHSEDPWGMYHLGIFFENEIFSMSMGGAEETINTLEHVKP